MTPLRRRLLLMLPALAAARALAQPASRVRRIGVISLTAREADPRLAEFEQALAELGYVDGKNLFIDWRSTDDRPERLPAIVTDLLQHPVELIVATMTTAIEVARRQTSTVPIVFVMSYDPVGSGFAQSMARPGRNMTGVAYNLANIAPQQLELVKLAVPNAQRIGVVLNPRNRTAAEVRHRFEDAAAKLGVELMVIQAANGQSLLGAVGAARSVGVRALVVQADGVFFQNRASFIEALAAQKMPALFTQAANVDAGGLMSYGPSDAENYRRAAWYVSRLLKGARASELAIERPVKIELSINTSTAASLGLHLPEALLQRADRIVR
jgi:putative ABC transport system substrate-binding protein